MRKNMEKNYILDTNVLLYDPASINSFGNNNIYIPLVTLEELDRFKKNPNELGTNAREVIRNLDELRAIGPLHEGVDLETGGKLYVKPILLKKNDLLELDESYADNKILYVAKKLQETHKDIKSIIITKDINLRVKSDALGIHSEDFTSEEDSEQNYEGITNIFLEEGDLHDLYENGRVSYSGDIGINNQYLVIYPKSDGTDEEIMESVDARHYKENEFVDDYMKRITIGKMFINEAGERTICLIGNGITARESLAGLKSRNIKQEFAINALLDADIGVVTIQGKAGTGKTLLALASSISLSHQGYFNRVTITRPLISVGKDMGALPGGIAEKIGPWMQAVYDAFDVIKQNDGINCKSEMSSKFIGKGVEDEDSILQVCPLSYIRGRSIANAFMIIDEAQNLSPLEVKTILTRAGEGTKVVFTGDTDQIDVPYFDKSSNGFSHLINKFKGNSVHAHITLTDGERSELAEIAAELL
jgi:PhoH-like ATPase